MGFSFRKSVRIVPGIRLNLSWAQRGATAGLSLGVRGARLSVNSRGMAQTSVSIPGTGLNYVARQNLLDKQGHLERPPLEAEAQRLNCGRWVGLGVLGIAALIAFLTQQRGGVRQPGQDALPANEGTAPTVQDRLYVTASALRCRENPDATAPVAHRFTSGQAVIVVERSGDWARVARPNTSCWVSSRYLAAEFAAPPKRAAQAQPRKFEAVPEARVRRGVSSRVSVFANCSEARAAGAAPVRRGDRGYSPRLDRDGDGVGCE
ncbi:DUF4236 domain-containing protein [Phenylobacterium sp. LjRoot219]|uniref:DUF4236 domain-containing protein n=1 Tax=Phenylobacterium sp. LjRoot219 TaxID=3342283 RepID=UPI003F502FB8